jgi:hypothetical protein
MVRAARHGGRMGWVLLVLGFERAGRPDERGEKPEQGGKVS